MAFNIASRFSPNMLARESIAGKFAQPQDGTQAQGATQAPANPFAGANHPAPSQPTPAPQPQPQVATPQQMAPQQVTPQQPRQLGMPMQRPILGNPYARPPQSVTQQVGQQATGRGGAQSVSNYLSALGQAGAGNNNAAMNYQGQIGQGPQAGFMGFGQNGIQTQLGGQFVGPQYQQQGLQFQNNMANTNQNYFTGNQASSPAMGYAAAPRLANTGGITSVNAPGLLSGAQNAPQWQTPQPWMNPADPSQNEAVWEGMSSDEKSAYLGMPREGGFLEKDPPQTYNWQTQPGSFYSTSDEAAKTNISDAKSELEDFMNQLGVYSYEYKDKAHGEGRYISPMAQEFEKSKLGKDAVVTDPQSGYKMVNYGRLMGVQTAALALLNHKYNELEKQFKKSIKSNIKNKRAK